MMLVARGRSSFPSMVNQNMRTVLLLNNRKFGILGNNKVIYKKHNASNEKNLLRTYGAIAGIVTIGVLTMSNTLMTSPSNLATNEEPPQNVVATNNNIVEHHENKSKSGALGEETNNRSESPKEEATPSFYIKTGKESPVKLFTGNSNQNLANEVAMRLGTQLGRIKTSRFSDGEVNIKVLDNVRGKTAFVIQSLAPPINESLMELILMITTLRRASANHIVAVIPYMGYTRYAREEIVPAPTQQLPQRSGNADNTRRPIASSDVAKMLIVAGVDHVVFCDVHHSQVNGFFGTTPVDDLDVTSIAATHFALKELQSPVVVAPDHDGVSRAKRFRDLLVKKGVSDASLAVVVDQRKGLHLVTATQEELQNNFDLVGDVRGKDCIIRDDIMESGFRVVNAAEKLKQKGALRIFAFVTHALLGEHAYRRVDESQLVELVCTNTLPLRNNMASEKITQLSVAALLSETIRRMAANESVSEMYESLEGKKNKSNNNNN